MTELSAVLLPLGGYVLLVLIVGGLAVRRAGRSPEEYFLAGRKLGSLVLFMALFGTNATAFVFVGVPGRAYHDGIGVFSVNAPIVALFTPLTFYLIGVPARRWAKRLDALTPAELYARKLASPAVGVTLFALFTIYTVPYMVSAVNGAAVTLAGMTGGGVPIWAGGLGVLAVALLYTTLGGMRATAWTNVLQGAIFLGFLAVVFVLITRDLGGFGEAMRRVAEHDERLLFLTRDGLFAPGRWISWSLLISLTVIAFPHMFVRLMAAGSERAIRSVCRFYPIALLLLWLPPVLIGVWGAMEFPGFAGRESDAIFQLVVERHLPATLASIGFVAVLAAVMSSLDAMILTLGSMLTRDVLGPFRRARSDRSDVLAGRVFGPVIAAVVYGLAQLPASVFSVASLAFSGYVTLVPTLFLGLRWKGFNRRGAMASLIVGSLTLHAGLAGLLPLFGFMPVFWAFLAACSAAWIGSKL